MHLSMNGLAMKRLEGNIVIETIEATRWLLATARRITLSTLTTALRRVLPTTKVATLRSTTLGGRVII